MPRRTLVWLGVVVWFVTLLSQSYQASQAAIPDGSDEISQRQSQSQKLMQQSDYRDRLDEQRKARLEEKQAFGLASLEPSSTGLDLAILVVLAVSVVAIVFFSWRKRRTGTIH